MNTNQILKLKKGKLLLSFLLLSFALGAKDSYGFRLYLTTKSETPFLITEPEAYLSKKAVARRAVFNCSIDSTDLPIVSHQIEQIEAMGATMVTSSKWNNTVVVSLSDSLEILKLMQLPFVKEVKCVYKGIFEQKTPTLPTTIQEKESLKESYYGVSQHQIEVLNGSFLHQAGFKGEGKTIAVIDAGFLNVDSLTGLKNSSILGTRNFVHPQQSVYTEHQHGTQVLSALAANLPNQLIGTAPNAAFWLLKSEDVPTEYPIEEDYLVAALEFADSVGVDVVNCSLGYTLFEDLNRSYSQSQLDGKQAFSSNTFSLASQKAMLLICSAGNEGAKPWQQITFPSDAQNVLTVGAVDSLLNWVPFSSVGYTIDGRVKPDLTAIGKSTWVLSGNGSIIQADGTSFSTPTICGLMTCLWQALPKFTPEELIKIIQSSCSQHQTPDKEKGYGVPDFKKAYQQGSETSF